MLGLELASSSSEAIYFTRNGKSNSESNAKYLPGNFAAALRALATQDFFSRSKFHSPFETFIHE